MGKILGISGKKQAGKNTTANYLFGLIMNNLGIVSEFNLNQLGELIVPMAPEEGAETPKYGILDPISRHPEIQSWLAENVWQYVRMYSFADKLKEFAIECLGLTEDQCYGSDEDKNSLVPHLLWENMPGVTTVKTPKNKGAIDSHELVYHPPGPMTAREVLQFYGSDIGRKMYGDIWVDATLRQIEKDDSLLAIVTDARFPNEVNGIRNKAGKVLRLTRNSKSDDKHISETSLDPAVFDWSNFDAIVDNETATIDEQNVLVVDELINWGWFESSETAEAA